MFNNIQGEEEAQHQSSGSLDNALMGARLGLEGLTTSSSNLSTRTRSNLSATQSTQSNPSSIQSQRSNPAHEKKVDKKTIELAKKLFVGQACNNDMFFVYRSSNSADEKEEFRNLASSSLVDAIDQYPSKNISPKTYHITI